MNITDDKSIKTKIQLIKVNAVLLVYHFKQRGGRTHVFFNHFRMGHHNGCLTLWGFERLKRGRVDVRLYMRKCEGGESINFPRRGVALAKPK